MYLLLLYISFKIKEGKHDRVKGKRYILSYVCDEESRFLLDLASC